MSRSATPSTTAGVTPADAGNRPTATRSADPGPHIDGRRTERIRQCRTTVQAELLDRTVQ